MLSALSVRGRRFGLVDDVMLQLDPDEALVLFEALSRWNDSDALDGVLVAGEPTALWALLAALERVVTAPMHRDYALLVEQARRRLVVRGGA